MGQATPLKADGVGATIFRERSSKVATQTPDPSGASRGPDREAGVRRDPRRHRIQTFEQGLGALSHVVFLEEISSIGGPCQTLSNHEDVLDAIERVTIGGKQIEIRLSESVAVDGLGRRLTIPWIPPSPYQRREIIQGKGEARLRSARCAFGRGRSSPILRNAHRWLDDLVTDPNQTIELIAAREGKSERSIRMTLSLAFIAPPIVAAAIEGRLPRGFGLSD